MAKKIYNLKDLPIGTKVKFMGGVKGIIKKAIRNPEKVRFSKSILMTHFSTGKKWPKNQYTKGYLDIPIVSIIKPKKRKK